MGNPLANLPIPSSTSSKKTVRKAAKFKVSQEPVMEAALVVGNSGSFFGGDGNGSHSNCVAEVSSSASGPSFPGGARLTQLSALADQSPNYHENFGTLPATYHEDTLFLIARDPRWLFSYWDFNWSRVPESEMRDARRAYYLRVLRLSGEVETLVEIHPGAKNWYVPVRDANTSYVAELGHFGRRGAWHSLVRSKEARTPADALASEAHNEVFATVPQTLTFERLQTLVQQHMEGGESLLEAISRITGEGHIHLRAGSPPSWTEEQKRLLAMLLGESLIDIVGLGSDEIDRLLRRALQEKLHSEAASGLTARLAAAFGPASSSLFSPMGASWSAQPFGVAQQRGFFMHLNAEIIFYGGTHPDASVSVNGTPIKLQPDGSFQYHFTLPDGEFEIPVVAISPDGKEERSGTLSFRRQTQRVGVVDATAQPVHLEPLMGRRHA